MSTRNLTEELFASMAPFLVPNLTTEQVDKIRESIDDAVETAKEMGWDAHSLSTYLRSHQL